MVAVLDGDDLVEIVLVHIRLMDASDGELEAVFGLGLFVQRQVAVEAHEVQFHAEVDIQIAVGGSDVGQISAVNLTDMDLIDSYGADMSNCLLISFRGNSIASGSSNLIRLSENRDLDIILEGAELADVDGRVVEVLKTEGKSLPDRFELYQNSPNPFNPATAIEYSVARRTHVKIAVYNVLGQTVATLVNEEVDAGRHQVIWNGRADNGNPTASGVYFYKMSTEDFIETRKMLMMR